MRHRGGRLGGDAHPPPSPGRRRSARWRAHATGPARAGPARRRDAGGAASGSGVGADGAPRPRERRPQPFVRGLEDRRLLAHRDSPSSASREASTASTVGMTGRLRSRGSVAACSTAVSMRVSSITSLLRSSSGRLTVHATRRVHPQTSTGRPVRPGAATPRTATARHQSSRPPDPRPRAPRPAPGPASRRRRAVNRRRAAVRPSPPRSAAT